MAVVATTVGIYENVDVCSSHIAIEWSPKTCYIKTCHVDCIYITFHDAFCAFCELNSDLLYKDIGNLETYGKQTHLILDVTTSKNITLSCV